MRRKLGVPIFAALFLGYGTAIAADSPAILGVDPVLIAIGSALASAVVALWKLHLDDDKRRNVDAEGWRTVGVGSVGDLGKLVESVRKIENSLKTEHTLAGKARDGDERFRDWVRSEVAEIQTKLEARA